MWWLTVHCAFRKWGVWGTERLSFETSRGAFTLFLWQLETFTGLLRSGASCVCSLIVLASETCFTKDLEIESTLNAAFFPKLKFCSKFWFIQLGWTQSWGSIKEVLGSIPAKADQGFPNLSAYDSQNSSAKDWWLPAVGIHQNLIQKQTKKRFKIQIGA